MQEEKNYKDTLNLPETTFAMKANLAQREPEMLKKWQDNGLYEAMRRKSAKKPLYVLHDGPPYANGKIHIGHALNKILKDMIVKYKTMRGFDAVYIPGWDCHGLPIEHQCLKDMGKRKEDVERVEFRKQARAYAEKFIAIQREDFKRLAVMGEWDKPYLTMDFPYQASIADSFLRLYEKGFIYQGMKPVPWCFDCETALADAELEYQDKVDQTIYVSFELGIAPGSALEDRCKLLGSSAKVSMLVWTTTPWTLPANVGLAVHPDLNYVLIQSDQGSFIAAQALAEALISKLGLVNSKVSGAEFKGSLLAGLDAAHPFLKRSSKVILADYVSATDGTGIVHIAPGHGEDDYQYGHGDNHLPVLSPVDSRGRFIEDLGAQFVETYPDYKGLHVFKSNEKIIELLKEKGALLHQESYSHPYPYCWRCKKPILFRATKQWFMRMDHEHLRRNMLKAIEGEIKFTPDWGKNRIGSMVETRPEWCLSRQRYWGVPIPVIGCVKCAGHFFVSESHAKIKDIFEKEGADAWFSRPSADFLPAGFQCSKCGGADFKKEDDIIDVWFDSGVSHQGVLRRLGEGYFPAALYLEGSDQHRGWFQSSLTTSMALEGQPPFKGVLTHGFVVDGTGKKMSKSAGNVVAPQDVIKEFGADILRLWVSACDYENDIRVSKDILNQLADAYRKIRNTFRYILSNLYDFDAAKDSIALEELHPLDRWAVHVTDQAVESVLKEYEAFQFHQIYQHIYHFSVVELSGYYFDALKDTLYTASKQSFLRRSAQTSLFYILSRLVKVLAPILPFTTDEVWQAYPLEAGSPSVLTSHIPEDWAKEKASPANFEVWSDLRQIRNAVTPVLEKQRAEKLIGAGLEAKVRLFTANAEAAQMIQSVLAELPRVFVVSQVEWAPDLQGAGDETVYQSLRWKGPIALKIQAVRAEGGKCLRCWNYSKVVGTHAEHPGLCGKCLEALVISNES